MQIEKLYLTETEASIRYGYSKQWFQRARWQGSGPSFVKKKGKVLYPIRETDGWFAEGMMQSTSQNNLVEE